MRCISFGSQITCEPTKGSTYVRNDMMFFTQPKPSLREKIVKVLTLEKLEEWLRILIECFRQPSMEDGLHFRYVKW